MEASHLQLYFRDGFATPVLGPRFPLSCALARAWCSRLSVLLFTAAARIGFMSGSNEINLTVCFLRSSPLIKLAEYSRNT